MRFWTFTTCYFTTSPRSRNKGHAQNTGFTVLSKSRQKWEASAFYSRQVWLHCNLLSVTVLLAQSVRNNQFCLCNSMQMLMNRPSRFVIIIQVNSSHNYHHSMKTREKNDKKILSKNTIHLFLHMGPTNDNTFLTPSCTLWQQLKVLTY